ncbi:MAG: iron-containing alcohol dehydrogenase [Verrucomicrobiota bacterium]|nr:iron-containing alcohol dehydrogenase [Limisphaera sp.]MDW8382109.1 iron-containing alcohol dehydrogenase [Verrucomicrobiota bacterium]
MHAPPTLVVGEGCAREAAQWLIGRGCRRALLVTCRSVADTCSGLFESWADAGVTLLKLAATPSEPTLHFFENLRASVRELEPDAVIGLGGGSALDVAKLLACLVGCSEPTAQFFGIHRLPGRRFPLVCLPTTAGTGSEVSPNAILLDETEGVKQAVISPFLVPDAAFVDPELTHSLPPFLTAASGFDALTHCIEAFANRHAHPWVDAWALQGIRWIGANLVRAVENGSDAEARRYVAYGSLCGGLCLGPVNTAAVHALAYPLGGRYRLPHGLANAMLLPHVLRFNLPAASDRYAEVARALGISAGNTSLECAGHGVDRIEQMARRCGLPGRLRELGIRETDLPGLARAALQVQRLLKNNPRNLTEADVLAIYKAAF